MADHPEINWTAELEASVLSAIANGASLRKAGKANGMSDSAIIWHVNDNASFAKQYAHAMSVRSDAEFEALQDEFGEEPQRLENGAIDHAWVNLKRLQIDTRKWALSKRLPKKYGDKVETVLTGADGGPIQSAITVEFVKPGEQEKAPADSEGRRES